MTIFPRRFPLCAAVAGALLPIPALASAAATPPVVVVIDHMKFGGVPAVKRGTTIVFVNRDMFQHSVTATNKSFNLELPPGKTARLRLTASGTFAFYCKYHPGMRGVLTVK
jgi:plastocyanin